MAEIIINGIAVSYAGNRVINGLSLTIGNGSFFTLLGPSGCGKTRFCARWLASCRWKPAEIRFGDRA